MDFNIYNDDDSPVMNVQQTYDINAVLSQKYRFILLLEKEMLSEIKLVIDFPLTEKVEESKL